jgi:hypothetical protein
VGALGRPAAWPQHAADSMPAIWTVVIESNYADFLDDEETRQ